MATPAGPGGVDAEKQQKETEAGAEISALVNYVQPVHFSSFESSESEKFIIFIRFLLKNVFFYSREVSIL